ncbi:ModD protein [Cytobacillus praedii]|uniref:ModD protein n=1 Tax=Cytobacillus praedii TaxID=1742358 RepID=UPI003F7ED08A
MNVNQQTLLDWMREDVPYFDLTTHLLNIGEQACIIEFYSRENAVLCGSEEVQAICKNVNAEVTKFTPSGTTLSSNETFFVVEGNFSALNNISKVAQNIFEYASSIATRTSRLQKRVREVNPNISILTTRKVFPGTKELAIKAVLAGGAYPHRLGLSETILLFKQHISFLGGFERLEKVVQTMRTKDCERKIIVEVDSKDEAMQIQSYSIDGIQYDKFSSEKLKETISQIKEMNPHLIHLATGGVNEQNAADYAETGIDGIVTTSVYFGKTTDIGVRFLKG